MSSSYSSLSSGSLIFREYKDFCGVDFSSRRDEIALNRSPEALNMWRNYKSSHGLCVETRPDVELVKEYEDTVYGLYFFADQRLVHCGSKLFADDVVVYEGLAEHKSVFFVYGSLLYILDSQRYLVYDGKMVKEVVGYVPTTTIGKSPVGNGTIYEDVNLLTGVRKNQFCADGKATEYHLDVEEFDGDYAVRVWVNGAELESGFRAVSSEGLIVFDVAPEKPLTDGQDNVIVQFRRTIEGYRKRIEHCTLAMVFDNRVFFSGNPDFPNMLWHCSLDDPTFCSDLDYYTEGADDGKIKALIAGNNSLWVMKEPCQSNTTIFYHNPSIDSEYGKIYPSSHSSVSIGCVASGINFQDDICFFSSRGLEAISSDVTTKQVVSHRSSLIDNRLLQEEHYEDLLLEVWQGYLLVMLDNKVYLADSRARHSMCGHMEYEWFYWEFEDRITGSFVKDEVLFLCFDDKVCVLSDDASDREVLSFWCTMADEMHYPQMWKTTNKKGTVVDCEGERISLLVKRDNEEFNKVGDYNTMLKGYFKPRIKAKKFKCVQLKFVSELPFCLYSATLEAYIGNVVKR